MAEPWELNKRRFDREGILSCVFLREGVRTLFRAHCLQMSQMMKSDETIRQELRQSGYSQEEYYFYLVNRELIEELHPRVPKKERLAAQDVKKHPVLKALKKLFLPREQEPHLF